MRFDDPAVQTPAPAQNAAGGRGLSYRSVFGWSRRWIAGQGLVRQYFPDELEIYGLHDGYDGGEGGANLTLAVPIV